MWQVTRDTWHVTYDTWHMTYSVGWTSSQNFSSLSFPLWDWQSLEYIWTKGSLTQSLNKSINHGGDCRTAPATPGLLRALKVVLCPPKWKKGVVFLFLPLKQIFWKSFNADNFDFICWLKNTKWYLLLCNI